MSETATGTRHVSTVFADTLGRDLVALVVGELRQAPDHWLRMNEQQQAQALERIRSRVKEVVIDCSAIIMSANYTMVKAELDGITIKDGVKINLSMAAGDPNRHSLYDAKGKSCLLVLAEAEQYLERMDEVKAAADQSDLFSGDYDPKDDQPGYRRDQPASAPAGKSWAQIKAEFEQGLITKTEAEKEYGGELPAEDPAPSMLDVKGGDRTGPILGTVEYRLQIGPDQWGPWAPIPTAELPTLDDNETMREALTAIHDPDTCEYRYFEPNNLPSDLYVDPASQAEIERLAVMAGLHDQLTEIGMTISLGAVQALSPEQRTHAGDWLIEYVQWAQQPKRKKKDIPKRPHFLPLFDPIPIPPPAGDATP